MRHHKKPFDVIQEQIEVIMDAIDEDRMSSYDDLNEGELMADRYHLHDEQVDALRAIEAVADHALKDLERGASKKLIASDLRFIQSKISELRKFS